MEEVHVGVDLKFECLACFAQLSYQKQPYNCPNGEENEGYVCDLELYSMDIYYTTEIQVDDEFF